jgi:hypothetical protein
MPEHVHPVIWLNGTRGTLGSVIGAAKSRATRVARAEGRLPHYEQLWQKSFHARWLPDDDAVQRAVHYAFANPRERARRSSG